MARSIRHNIEGGWYHITTRGLGRQRIFVDERYSSVYLHLNPVRIKALGQGKSNRAAERLCVSAPVSTSVLLRRLDRLREHKWSSYPVYAGYRKKPEWLTCAAIWQKARSGNESGATAYRRYLEEYVKQGAEEDILRKATAALAIGSTQFVEGLRKRLPGRAGEQSNVRQWRRLLPFEAVRKAVEAAKGETWESFVNRRGDTGRDLALYYSRQYGGFTLHELGDYSQCGTFAVSKAISRIKSRLQTDQNLRQILKKIDGWVKSASDCGAEIK